MTSLMKLGNRLGDPFNTYSSPGSGLLFINNTGGTISKGQVAAIEFANSTSPFYTLCTVNATTQKHMLALALDNCTSGAQGFFITLGQALGLVANGVLGGSYLTAATASTGGSNLLLHNTNSGFVSCGFVVPGGTGNGSTPVQVVFDGQSRIGAFSGAI